jgi:hypothetical protein
MIYWFSKLVLLQIYVEIFEGEFEIFILKTKINE